MDYEQIKKLITDTLNKKIISENLYTQVEFAKLVGVTKQAVAGWLKGSTPDAARIPAICNALNITVEELLGIETLNSLSEKEIALLRAYNTHKDEQPIIDKILDIKKD